MQRKQAVACRYDLNINGTFSRRSLLQVGSLGVGGLTLPNLLRQQAQAAEAGQPVKKKSVILVWLAGGPSHLDMYDLKPQAPAEFRGEFRPIRTNVPGIEISEHLPMQAKIMDKLAIVRSAFHTNAGHGMGSQWMLTGYQPTIEVNDNIYPSLGSVVAQTNGANDPGFRPMSICRGRCHSVKRLIWVRRTIHSRPKAIPTRTAFKFAI